MDTVDLQTTRDPPTVLTTPRHKKGASQPPHKSLVFLRDQPGLELFLGERRVIIETLDDFASGFADQLDLALGLNALGDAVETEIFRHLLKEGWSE